MTTATVPATPVGPGQLELFPVPSPRIVLTCARPDGSPLTDADLTALAELARTATTYPVHAADDRHLRVTRGDADAGAWSVLHAPPAPVRRTEFSQISLHTDHHPTPATERPTPSCR
ncbi:hypothetical protein AB0K09_03410 [Streptomyces sp. NPDC049577]|uniref:hypothetical protein n=1 Tax=Streptomyces sp. NPDC049577 TaxID=3155153 RepID=UPI003433D099